MKKMIVVLVGVAVLVGIARTESLAQCSCRKDNAYSPEVRAVLDDMFGFFSKYELITQPLDRKDIALHSEPTLSGSCPQHGKITLSMDHILVNAKVLGDVTPDSKTLSSMSKQRLMVAVHPMISHHYAHLQHNKFSLFTGVKQSPQEIEYHTDFIAGYLNGRSMLYSQNRHGRILPVGGEEDKLSMLKNVFDRDKVKMRAVFKSLITEMKEYQQVNALVHNKNHRYLGLEIERKKAYLNGFMSALNYEILGWNRADNEKMAKWVEFFYEPLPEAKKRFSRNLFAFLGEELDVVVDSALMSESIAPSELMEKGDIYVSNLIQVPTLTALNSQEGDN